MKRILAVIGACLGLSACVVSDGYGYYDDYSGYNNRYYGADNTRYYYSDYYGYNRPYVYNNYYTNRYYNDRNDRRYNRNDRRYDRDDRRPHNNARPTVNNRPVINRPDRAPNRIDRPQAQRPSYTPRIDRANRDREDRNILNNRSSNRSFFERRSGGRVANDSR